MMGLQDLLQFDRIPGQDPADLGKVEAQPASVRAGLINPRCS